MKQMRAPLYLALILLTQCSSCKDRDPAPKLLPTLPPETQTGARTFGCLINGRPFVAPYSLSSRGDDLTANSLGIGADMRSGEQNATLHMRLVGSLFDDKFYFLQPNPISGPFTTIGFYADALLLGGCDYRGRNIRQGNLTLTRYDPAARIASGRFAFTLYEPGGCDTLRVTEGRFDVKF